MVKQSKGVKFMPGKIIGIDGKECWKGYRYGGTSDGRFMAKICDQVIEFGLINKSIHKINEHTTVNDIQKLSRIFINACSKVYER